jgi:hypothetical protein
MGVLSVAGGTFVSWKIVLNLLTHYRQFVVLVVVVVTIFCA